MTPKELKALSEPERLALLERSALAHYGPTWIQKLADEFDYDRKSVYNWTTGTRIPLAVLMQLSDWTTGTTGKLREIRGEIEALAQLMAEVARRMEKISKAASRS